MYFSKSKYVASRRCLKEIWLLKYKPEEETKSEDSLKYTEEGNKVGALARNYFGEYIDVSSYDTDGKLNIKEMILKTNECLKNGVENICEASFSYNGLYCAVDILHKENGGYAIYEVKSATDVKNYYYKDVAYQKYVLEKCGINVTGTYILHIDNTYVRCGDIELDKLFKKVDVKDKIKEEYNLVEQNIKEIETVLSSNIEPDIDIDLNCYKNDKTYPYECPFYKYCSKHLPQNNVFDLYRIQKRTAIKHYKNGIITFDDIVRHDASAKKDDRIVKNNKIQRLQIDLELNNLESHIDKDIINNFLNELSYPLYFLDFETMEEAIPPFDGTWPRQQIPFQYSLHYIDCEDGELKHKEFLAISGENPLHDIAESICKDIPKDVCILVYNDTFEKKRLKELASMFPDLSEHLLNIKNNIKDLEDPFTSGGYYNKDMKSSFSIKSVLPAIFPLDPELNYHNLDGVHNGTEAMDIFPKIKDMPKDEQEKTRKNLLEYCKLDTYAMVKIWQEFLKYKI